MVPRRLHTGRLHSIVAAASLFLAPLICRLRPKKPSPANRQIANPTTDSIDADDANSRRKGQAKLQTSLGFMLFVPNLGGAFQSNRTSCAVEDM
jgi:hypothetical protein